MLIDGTAALSGVDLMELPIHRWLAAVYTFVTSRLDPRTKTSFDMELDRPGPGETPEVGPWSDEAMASSFLALNQELGG